MEGRRDRNALASLGETVSGLFASKAGEPISEKQFEKLDSFCYKVENGLISLIKSLEDKLPIQNY